MDWREYPVIHLDMGSCAAESVEELEYKIELCVNYQAELNSIQLITKGAAPRFQELVQKLSESDRKVVILVDEYDKPLLCRIGQSNVSEFQRVLKSFYSVIKTTESAQRFVLLTGVSKFSKVSIFSDLNNLTELTMQKSVATLLGYTQEELENNFGEYIEKLALENGMSKDEALEGLKTWYNGYRFEETSPTIYNPVSVMKCFQEKKFKNFWFETGTPSFLIELLKKNPVKLDDLVVPETSFSEYDPANLSPLPLLVQTGYLTIESAVNTGWSREFHLCYPNREITSAFSYWMAKSFSEADDLEISSALRMIIAALRVGDLDSVFEHLKVFFATVPNRITLKHEKYYQTIFFVIFKLIGAALESEVSTNIGYIDAVVKTESAIYVIEFKLRDTAEAALKQIEEKGYALRYQDDTREVVKVGVAFSEELRNVDNWLID